MYPIPSHISYEALKYLSALPQDIPIVEGPLRGPQQHGDSTDYGGISIPHQYADDYQRARDYLSYGQYTLTPEEAQSPTSRSINLGVGDSVMRSAFMRLEDTFHSNGWTPKTIIEVNQDGVDSFRCKQSGPMSIAWSPHTALMTADGKGISPAMCLGHEVIHANHYLESEDLFILRALTPVDRYTNREEQLTIERENTAAHILGEGIRKSHGTGTFSIKYFSGQSIASVVSHPMETRGNSDHYDLIKTAIDSTKIYSSVNFFDLDNVKQSLVLADSGAGWEKYLTKQYKKAKILYYRGVIRSLKHEVLPRLGRKFSRRVCSLFRGKSSS